MLLPSVSIDRASNNDSYIQAFIHTSQCYQLIRHLLKLMAYQKQFEN